MAQIIYVVLDDLSTPSFELKGISDTLLSLASLYLPLFRPFLLPGMPPLFCSTHPGFTGLPGSADVQPSLPPYSDSFF